MKFLQEMAWLVTYLMLGGKIIDLNNYKTDILYDVIEDFRLYFEYNRDGKGGLGWPK